ncbi:MAG: Lrp/AsnC family transcriptional regulator [Sphingomonadaceae bacterium]|uniref:Lrp/AsnC family transcriptional regulator n=1 Tax=Thermaurantiacus sp. TaxID=2820283 RepID=UPI00298ED94F|nr:Lrp/AsnC family transcriptional regulator [Thermaurantiacus sp.]MCS6987319.1 Lrp/AsnC family transcriptional regulator [Sphingomonadaceae bacterium]MDW8414540.1 Lrp/AsnC family transcriptional regulator [Thermaurantiacus sp.]
MLDRIDLKILEVLQREGRTTNAALANAVALSPSACLARVRRLERTGVIRGYRAIVAIEKVRPVLVMLAEIALKRHDPEDFRAVEAMFAADPRVLEAAEISGGSDYWVKACVADMAEWRELTAGWTREPSPIARVTSRVVMHLAKEPAPWPLASGTAPARRGDR